MIKYVIIGIVFFMNLNFVPLYALLPLLFLIFWFYPSNNDLRTVWILVLGDIGHSPRIFNQVGNKVLRVVDQRWEKSSKYLFRP